MDVARSAKSAASAGFIFAGAACLLVHELDQRVAQWVALRLSPVAAACSSFGAMIRWAREWPWYVGAICAFGTVRFIAFSSGDATVLGWAGVLLASGGALVALKRR